MVSQPVTSTNSPTIAGINAFRDLLMVAVRGIFDRWTILGVLALLVIGHTLEVSLGVGNPTLLSKVEQTASTIADSRLGHVPAEPIHYAMEGTRY